jgi:uncharacterized protein
MRQTLLTIVLIAAVMAVRQVFDLLGVPAPALFAGLLVGLVVAMACHVEVVVPRRLYALSQGVLGAVVGTLGATAMHAPGSGLVAVPLAIVATMAMSLLAGRLLSRHRLVATDTGVLGMVAGGSTAVIAAADETGADARVVAVSQYLRIAAVALTAPFVADVLAGGAHGPAAGSESEPLLELGLSGTAVIAVATLGISAGRRLRLPAAPVAGPLALGLVLAMAGVIPEAAPPPLLTQVAFGLVGAEIGLRFEPEVMRALRSVLPVILVLTVALSVGCALVAIALNEIAEVPALDAYLMTTPGGINAVIATALSLNGVNLGLVTLTQIGRMLAMVFLVSALVRFLGARREAPPWTSRRDIERGSS